MNNFESIQYPSPKQEYKVLVRCFTYNHKDYIEDALNGFAMQQTDFPYVCLVVDDASTDGEQEVIKKWMECECDMSKAEIIDIPTSAVIIVPHRVNQSCEFAFYMFKQNLYGTGEKKMNHVYPWRERCKYEAMCEGDDYWTDPLKLQKQVDFLEANPEYTMCFARAIEHYEDGSREDELFSLVEDRDYEGIEFFENWIVATASVLYRKEILSSPLCKEYQANKKIIFGDTPLFLTCAHYGKVRGMSDVVSVYRRHEGGITRAVLKDYNRCKRYHYHELEIYKVFGDVYKKKSIEVFVKGHCNVFWETFWRRGLKTRYDFLHESLSVSVCVTIKVLCEMFKTRLKRRMGRTLPSKKENE